MIPMGIRPMRPIFFRTTLARSLADGGSETEIYLNSITTKDGHTLDESDFGDILFLVINPTGENRELVSITSLTSGTPSYGSGLTRGYNFYNSSTSSSRKKSHSPGEVVIVTNDEHYLYTQYVPIDGDVTIADVKTFSSLPRTTAGNPVADNDLARKAYVDSVVGGISSTINVIVPGTAGETVAAGNLIYFDDTDNEWKKCDADTAATVENTMLGIAQGAGVDGGSIAGGVLVRGLDANQSGLTAGAIYYASNTAGAISASAGTKEVTIGFSYSTTQLYFNPRFNQQLTEDQQDALAGTAGTPSASNPFTTNDDTTGTGLLLRRSFYKFGGDGSDGALIISSGTTTLDAAGAKILVKNYTSISITGTGKITVSNPHAGGTILILRSQGAVTLTSSATVIDLKGLGATSATNPNYLLGSAAPKGVTSSSGSGGAGGAAFDATDKYAIDSAVALYRRNLDLACGAGGGTGMTRDGAGGAGGRGGGALLIECAGAFNFTTGTIDVSGNNGTAGGNSVDDGGGGGGGGSCGMALVLYNSLTANTGTYTATGGTGGAAGTSGASGSNASAGGGGGAGSFVAAGGAGGTNNSTGSAAAGLGAGGGGGGTDGVTGGAAGGAAGGNASATVCLVAQNYYF